MHRWAERVAALAADDPVVMLSVVATKGSTPRDVGARMLVSSESIIGSIGGGRLEFDEATHARGLLARHRELGSWHRQVRHIVLGPDAGQCCGGVVEVLHEVFGAVEALALGALLRQSRASHVARSLISGLPPKLVIPASCICTRGVTAGTQAGQLHEDDEGRSWTEPLAPPLPTLHLYGAGHTAREIVRIAEGFALDIDWVDVAADRFPQSERSIVKRVVDTQPQDHAHAAESGGLHLVMTHSHDLDYAICEALLLRDEFLFLGLIGSATKRARFVQRFRRVGITEAALARLTCPIGIDAIVGKTPAVVALSAVAQLVVLLPQMRV